MKKRKIDRSFLNNRGVNILLSLGIALLIWTIVTVYIDPVGERVRVITAR